MSNPDPIRKAIAELLASDSGLGELLDTPEAIYHEQAPLNAATPYVIFNRMSGVRARAFAGSPVKDQVWLIKAVCRGHRAGPAEEIDAALETLCDLARVTPEGYRSVGKLIRESDVSYAEGSAGQQVHYVGGQYRLQVERESS